MTHRPHRSRVSNRSAQRGQAVIFIAVLVAFGILAAVFTMASTRSVSIANRQADDTAKTLTEVKNALIAWSAARTPPDATSQIRPGELPCPDSNNSGTDPGGCSAGAIGRVPWKSLGIPEPKDGTGETLWYAISGPFRYYGAGNTGAITSDTLGTLTVYHGSSATTLTSQAIAVIFAPGPTLGTQNRDPATTALCSTTGTTIARNLCASNYLEATGGGNNAQTGGPFIQAVSSSTFNDRVLAITTADLMPLVEQRVAREMISYLNRYRAALGVYPWADLGDGNGNGAQGTFAYNRNRFPCGTPPPAASWLAAIGEPLPNWLTNGCASLTGWAKVVFYTVAKNRLQNSGSGCSPWPNCTSSTLSITNSGSLVATQCDTSSPPTCVSTAISSGSADLLLMTPGAWDGTTSRIWPTSGWTPITGYFDDSANSDNDDDSYVVPTSTNYNRDRIFVVR